MNITVIGLGKLGLPSAACLADAGYKVIGYDTNLDHVAALQKGQCPIREPGIESLLSHCSKNLSFTSDLSEAVKHGDFFFIIVPTPSTKNNPKFDNGYVVAALQSMIPFLKEKNGYFVIDIVSTVMPGSCNNVFLPMLKSGLGDLEFGLVYNPEFIALGDVISGFTHPDLLLIGESEPRAGDMAVDVYSQMITMFTIHIVSRMSLISAEIAKLALNYYVTTKISFANWLAISVASKYPGSDIDDILRAVGKDTRIGGKYLTSGTAFGGPCFPRDVRAMRSIAEPMFQEEVNQAVNATIVNCCEGDVAILGMAYKPGTHVTEESASMRLAKHVASLGYMRWFDYYTKPADLQFENQDDQFGDDSFCIDPYEACDGADTVVLMTPSIYWKKLNWDTIAKNMKGNKVIVDPWRLLKGSLDWDDLGVHYIPIGCNT